VCSSDLYTWREQLEPRESNGPPEHSREAPLRKEVSRLKRVLAEKVLEVDFFKGALHTVEARRQRNGIAGAQASTPTRIGTSITSARTLRPSSSATTIAIGCIQRSATDHRRSSNAPWLPRTRRGERPRGFLSTRSFLEPMKGRSEERNPLTGRCAHSKLSQRRGSPQLFPPLPTDGPSHFTLSGCQHLTFGASSGQQ
jgi:hypothetical protein